MKRPCTVEEQTSSKRQRKNVASDVFDDPSLANCFCNVDTTNSTAGYFKGAVYMAWPKASATKLMFAVETPCLVTNKSHQFSVTCEGDWVRHLNATPQLRDDIWLSLDGASSVARSDAKHKKGNAALRREKLVYEEGIILKWSRLGKNSPYFVNTWQGPPVGDAQDDVNDSLEDWFITPAQPSNEPLSEIARRTSNIGLASLRKEGEQETMSGDKSIGKAADERGGSVASVNGSGFVAHKTDETVVQPSAEPQEAVRQSNKQRKREKKKQKAALRMAARTSEQQVPGPAMPQPELVSARTVLGNLNTPSESRQKPEDVQLINVHEPSNIANSPTLTPRLKANLKDFRLLKEVNKADQYIGLIGVVNSSREPRMTVKGDWQTTVYLKDPSICEDETSLNYNDLAVIFFTRESSEWLPRPSPGDILITHDVKIQDYHGEVNCVGYYDRAKWAIYSPNKLCYHHGERGDTPESVKLGVEDKIFSPFYHPGPLEVQYSAQLSDWWKWWQAKLEKTSASVEVHQLGTSSSTYLTPKRVGRQHRLLSEAGPEVPPNGYFDCTLEVLNGFSNDNGVYSLYATDYTMNRFVFPCQSQWCPSGLNDFVVKFELWDAAATVGPALEPGTYISVRNARMMNNGGYIEGKIVENKISKLDPGTPDVHLQALLERKKAWKEANQGIKAEHLLIKDVRAEIHFRCTVELLHIDNSKYDVVYIYVTDYTAHPDLSSHKYGMEWSKDLEGRIVTILLHDAQRNAAKHLSIGSYILIENLRLRYNATKGRLQGVLGGQDILIHKLNVNKPNDELKALLKRKEGWEAQRELQSKVRINQTPSNTTPRRSPIERSATLEGKPTDMEASLKASQIRNPTSTIKQMQACIKEVAKFRVLAMVEDVYPRAPTECIRAWCFHCKKDIPEGRLACFQCGDTDHEHVRYKFRMFLQIKDSSNDRVIVLLNDESLLLRDLKLADNYNDPSILSSLEKRLYPLLCNKEEVSEKSDGQLLPFVLGSWKDNSGDRKYVLYNMEL